jgi:uncharacterized protein (DUF1778 family)
MSRKRSRLNVRLANGDAALVRAGAERLDMSMSELVRAAAVQAAVKAVRGESPFAPRVEVAA